MLWLIPRNFQILQSLMDDSWTMTLVEYEHEHFVCCMNASWEDFWKKNSEFKDLAWQNLTKLARNMANFVKIFHATRKICREFLCKILTDFCQKLLSRYFYTLLYHSSSGSFLWPIRKHRKQSKIRTNFQLNFIDSLSLRCICSISVR